MSGSYNLGFVALRATEVSRRMLRWWQERLYDKCLVRISEALFVDQKWMDLAPGLFKDVLVLNHPGYNAAYWNLHGRDDHPRRGRLAGQRAAAPLLPLLRHQPGEPRRGLEAPGPLPPGRHRRRGGPLPALRQEGAGRGLRRMPGPGPTPSANFRTGWPFRTSPARSTTASAPAKQKKFGNPFEAGAPGSFFHWLNGPQAGDGRRRAALPVAPALPPDRPAAGPPGRLPRPGRRRPGRLLGLAAARPGTTRCGSPTCGWAPS